MKSFTLFFTFLLISSVGLFAQSGMTIKSGGAVTVNGNLTIMPFLCGTPLTDRRDGKPYNTVLIGTQCWMAQNLNIGNKILGSLEQTNDGILEKYCYNDLESGCDVYGGLYQWDEAMQYVTAEGVQGICPSGWHLPNDPEWTTLTDYLGGLGVAGGKMKEVGYTHWASPNLGATNSSGFSGFGGGNRYHDGIFHNITSYGIFWSSSQDDASYKFNRKLDYYFENVTRGWGYKFGGFSVRCLKD